MAQTITQGNVQLFINILLFVLLLLVQKGTWYQCSAIVTISKNRIQYYSQCHGCNTMLRVSDTWSDGGSMAAPSGIKGKSAVRTRTSLRWMWTMFTDCTMYKYRPPTASETRSSPCLPSGVTPGREVRLTGGKFCIVDRDRQWSLLYAWSINP